MRPAICCILLLAAGVSMAQDPAELPILEYSTPRSASEAFSDKKLDGQYTFSYHLNPFYLRGDFNGDKMNDIVIPVKEKATGKTGLAVVHAGTWEVFVLGAGQAFNDIDDFREFNYWSVASESIVRSRWEKEPMKLNGEAISIGVFGCTGALIHWDGKKYCWYQMAD